MRLSDTMSLASVGVRESIDSLAWVAVDQDNRSAG